MMSVTTLGIATTDMDFENVGSEMLLSNMNIYSRVSPNNIISKYTGGAQYRSCCW
jgi:hypothetical protein